LLEDAGALVVMIEKLERVEARTRRCERELRAVEQLGDPPSLIDTADLAQVICRIEDAEQMTLHAQQRAAALANLTEPQPPQEIGPMADFLSRVQTMEKAIAQHLARRVQADEELEKVEQLIAAWLEENPMCPTCGSATSLESVMTGGHAHE
jgi:hypothetical protein